MSTPFHDRCEELRYLANIPAAGLQVIADAEASLALFEIDGALVGVACVAELSDWCFTRVDFGPIDSSEQALWGELLEMNYCQLGEYAGTFAADDDTGHAILQQRWPRTASSQTMYEVLRRQCQFAATWRSVLSRADRSGSAARAAHAAGIA